MGLMVQVSDCSLCIEADSCSNPTLHSRGLVPPIPVYEVLGSLCFHMKTADDTPKPLQVR